MQIHKPFVATSLITGNRMPIYSTKVVGNRIIVQLSQPKMIFRKINRKPKPKPSIKVWLKAIKSLTN